MQDFLSRLDQQLAVIAEPPPGRTTFASEAPPRHQRSARRRPMLTGGAVAAIAGTAVFAMTGTSTAGLPILATPTTDASAVREAAPSAQAAGVDFSDAHAFQTPAGPGYVLVNPETDALCMVVPDPTAPGDVGSSCAPRRGDVERDGLAAEFPANRAVDPSATALSVFLLPEGAQDVRLSVNGRRSTPDVESGVAVMQLPAAGTLTWTNDGVAGQRHFEGPLTTRPTMGFLCSDGTPRSIDGLPAHPSRERIREARHQACAE